MRRRLLSTFLALAVSAGVLWWLLFDADVVRAPMVAVDRTRLWRLLVALALFPVIQWLRAWRFALMLTGRLRPPGWLMFRVAAQLVVFNFLLPFKLGELSFPLLMNRAFGTEISCSAGILILARLVDSAVLCSGLTLCAAAALDLSALGWSRSALVVLGIFALAAPLVAVKAAAPLLVLAPATLAPLASRLLWGVTMLRAGPQRILALALTVGIWGTHAGLAYFATSAVVEGLGFLPAALAGLAANVAFALPVPAVAGLGPPQAAWAAALNLTGVAWDTAVATALIAHGVLLAGILVLGAATFAAPGRLQQSFSKHLASGQ